MISLTATLSLLLFGIASAQSCSNNLSIKYPAPVAASGWQFRLIANGAAGPRPGRGVDAFDAE
jgi:hypothetical protein